MQKLLSQIIRFAYYMLRARAQEIKIKKIYISTGGIQLC